MFLDKYEKEIEIICPVCGDGLMSIEILKEGLGECPECGREIAIGELKQITLGWSLSRDKVEFKQYLKSYWGITLEEYEELVEEESMKLQMVHEEKFKKVCPICGGSDLFYEAGGYAGMIYHCKNCDYVGPLIVEANEALVEKLKKQYDQNNR